MVQIIQCKIFTTSIATNVTITAATTTDNATTFPDITVITITTSSTATTVTIIRTTTTFITFIIITVISASIATTTCTATTTVYDYSFYHYYYYTNTTNTLLLFIFSSHHSFIHIWTKQWIHKQNNEKVCIEIKSTFLDMHTIKRNWFKKIILEYYICISIKPLVLNSLQVIYAAKFPYLPMETI